MLRHADVWPELAAAGLPVRRLRVRVRRRRDARPPRQGPPRRRRRPRGRRARERTASRSARRSCRSRRGRRRPASSTLLDFVADHDLVDSVDPVQYTIRLLLPRGLAAARPPRPRALPRRLGRRAAHLRLARGRPRGRRAPRRGRRAGRGPHRGRRRCGGGLRGRCARPRARRDVDLARRHPRPTPPHRELVLLRRAHRAPARHPRAFWRRVPVPFPVVIAPRAVERRPRRDSAS